MTVVESVVRFPPHSGLPVLVIVLLLWILMAGYADLRYRPVEPLGENAASDQFSAGRAAKHLPIVVDGQKSRAAGTSQNDEARNRIVDLLESFGYETQIQSGVGSVNPLVRQRSEQEIVPVNNILVRLRGKDPHSAILLAAHFDSVPYGPGASDDGVGTAAVIEIARMLSRAEPPDHDMIFLLTDGEELGLLGATLFVKNHTWAKDVAVAINLEARGTSGPSLMFQTSSASRWLVPLFGRVSPKPFSSSLFYEIYKRLPNDTDFSKFRDAGMQGYDFAFIGDVKNYHTVDDCLENVSLGSLQHHGQHALGLMRELDKLDFEKQPTGRVVYFDLFGWKLIWWPAKWSQWFTIGAAVLLITYLSLRRRLAADGSRPSLRKTWLPSIAAFLLVALTIAATLGSGWILLWLAELDPRLRNLWPNSPVPYLLSYWLAMITVLSFCSLVLLNRFNLAMIATSVLVFWLFLAGLVSAWVTGASHLFVVPVMVTAAGGLLAVRSESSWTGIAFLFPVAVGVMWISLERLFYDAVGLRMPLLMLIRVSIVSSSLLPALRMLSSKEQFRVSITGVVATAVSFLLAVFLNPVD